MPPQPLEVPVWLATAIGDFDHRGVQAIDRSRVPMLYVSLDATEKASSQLAVVEIGEKNIRISPIERREVSEATDL